MGKKITNESVIEKCKAVHCGKYDYSKLEYINSKTPLRNDDGNLSIAAQSKPTTMRDVYGDNDDSEACIRYRSSDGSNKITTTASYARDPRNFRGNQDMHDLENDRIAQANADAAAEGDYMRRMTGLEESIRKIVNKHVKKALSEIIGRK